MPIAIQMPVLSMSAMFFNAARSSAVAPKISSSGRSVCKGDTRAARAARPPLLKVRSQPAAELATTARVKDHRARKRAVLDPRASVLASKLTQDHAAGQDRIGLERAVVACCRPARPCWSGSSATRCWACQHRRLRISLGILPVTLSGRLGDGLSGGGWWRAVMPAYRSCSAAESINDLDVPAYLYHLGDFDPSGVKAGEKIEETLCKLAPDAEIYFERIAVTPAQIAAWDLPTRPTKKTDSRARKFGDKSDKSVELDAIDPDRLRALVRDAIDQHLPAEQFDVLKAAEQSERRQITALIGMLIDNDENDEEEEDNDG